MTLSRIVASCASCSLTLLPLGPSIVLDSTTEPWGSAIQTPWSEEVATIVLAGEDGRVRVAEADADVHRSVHRVALDEGAARAPNEDPLGVLGRVPSDHGIHGVDQADPRCADELVVLDDAAARFLHVQVLQGVAPDHVPGAAAVRGADDEVVDRAVEDRVRVAARRDQDSTARISEREILQHAAARVHLELVPRVALERPGLDRHSFREQGHGRLVEAVELHPVAGLTAQGERLVDDGERARASGERQLLGNERGQGSTTSIAKRSDAGGQGSERCSHRGPAGLLGELESNGTRGETRAINPGAPRAARVRT